MLEETPSNLIRSTIENFQIEPDLATLDRITENLDLLAEKRSGRTNEQRDILKNLSAQKKYLEASVHQLEHSDQRIKIQTSFQQLEQDKFNIAKSLTDLEINQSILNTNLSILNETYEKLVLDEDNLLNNEVNENFDSVVLKLKLFKTMGIVIDTKSDPNKLVVYNKVQDAVNVLTVDDNYSNYFITNYVWDAL